MVVSFTRLYSFSSLCKDVFSRACAMYDMFSLDQFSASVTTQHASLTRSLSPMTASVSSLTLNKADQFSSVQDGIFALRNSPYAFHPIWHLSEVSPSLPLKWFQCLIDDGLSSFQGRSSSASSFHAFLLQWIDGDVFCFIVPTGIVSSSSTLSDLPRSRPHVHKAPEQSSLV